MSSAMAAHIKCPIPFQAIDYDNFFEVKSFTV